MRAKKISALIVIMAFSLLTQSCFVGELLPDNPIPERTLEINNAYETIWSLPNIYMGTCKRRSLMDSVPGIIFVEGGLSKLGIPSVLAIDSLKGDTVWQIKPLPEYDGIILAQGKVLYRAITGAAKVEAFNTTDGALLWETELPGGHSASTLYFAENKIFVSTNDNEFFVLNNQGKVLVHVSPAPMIYAEMDGIMYLQNTAFRAFELASARELWQIDADFVRPPIFDAGTIFLRTADVEGFIYSIDQHTGKVNWKVSHNMYSNLFVVGRKIYFISLDGYLVAIDRNSGIELSKVKFYSTPFEFSDQDYCITGDAANSVLAVAFGDNNQILGLKIKNP
jgi:outer membrane protein assembly factor BamB